MEKKGNSRELIEFRESYFKEISKQAKIVPGVGAYDVTKLKPKIKGCYK